MTGEVRGGLTLLVGVVALRLALTDTYLRYVKASMRPWLLIAGVVLIGLGGLSVLRRDRAPAGDVVDDGHHGEHVPRVAWLLVLPVLAVFLVAPSSLGAYAAGRQSSAAPTEPTSAFPPLPPAVRGAVPLSHTEFVTRAFFDDAGSLAETPVRLTGFVTPADDAGGFLLTRFVLSCCAADGRPVHIRVTGTGPTPPADTWLEVVGTWQPSADDGDDQPIELAATGTTPVKPPANPYE